jgi:hypothetical protein
VVIPEDGYGRWQLPREPTGEQAGSTGRFSRPGTDGPQDMTTTAGSACTTPSMPLRCSPPPRTPCCTLRPTLPPALHRPGGITVCAHAGQDGRSAHRKRPSNCDAGQQKDPPHQAVATAAKTRVSLPSDRPGSCHLETAVTDSEHPYAPTASDIAPNADSERLAAVSVKRVAARE